MRSRKKIITLFLVLIKLAILIALGIGLKHLYTSLFLIPADKINCILLPESPCPEAIQVELQRYQGTSLINLNLSRLKAKLLGSSPRITKVDLYTALPASLSAQISEHHEIAQFKTSTSSGFLTATSDYKITNYSTKPVSDLTIVTASAAAELRVNQPVDSFVIKKSIDAVALLQEHVVSIKELTVEGNTLSGIVSSGQEIKLNLIEDISNQIKVIELVLAQDYLDKIKTIDVRFEKPILIFNSG